MCQIKGYILSRLLKSPNILWGEFYPDSGLIQAFAKKTYMQVVDELDLSFIALPLRENNVMGDGLNVRNYKEANLDKLKDCSLPFLADLDLSFLTRANKRVDTLLLLDGPFQYFSSQVHFLDWVRALKREAKLVKEVISQYMDWLLSLMGMLEDRVAGFVIADDLAGDRGPLYSPSMLDDFYFPYLRRLCRSSDKEVIIHCDGNVEALLSGYHQSGAAGLQSLDGVSPDQIAQWAILYPDFIFWGGLPREYLINDDGLAYKRLVELKYLFQEGIPIMLGSTTGILDEGMEPSILKKIARKRLGFL